MHSLHCYSCVQSFDIYNLQSVYIWLYEAQNHLHKAPCQVIYIMILLKQQNTIYVTCTVYVHDTIQLENSQQVCIGNNTFLLYLHMMLECISTN